MRLTKREIALVLHFLMRVLPKGDEEQAQLIELIRKLSAER